MCDGPLTCEVHTSEQRRAVRVHILGEAADALKVLHFFFLSTEISPTPRTVIIFRYL